MEFICVPAYDKPHNRPVQPVQCMGRLMVEYKSIRSDRKLVLLTAREAAEYLRVSLSTLNRLERRGLLSPMRMPGGHRRYTLEMLNDCLTRNQVETEVGK